MIINEGYNSVVKTYGREVADELVTLDTTPQKKYLDWMARYYTKEHMLPSFLSWMVKEFDKLQKLGFPEFKGASIDKFKPAQLFQIIDSNRGYISKSEQDRAAKGQGSRLVFENDKLRLIQVVSRAAACLYGKGTQWCIASTSDPAHWENERENYDTFLFLLPKTAASFDKPIKYALALSYTVYSYLGDSCPVAAIVYDERDFRIGETDISPAGWRSSYHEVNIDDSNVEELIEKTIEVRTDYFSDDDRPEVENQIYEELLEELATEWEDFLMYIKDVPMQKIMQGIKAQSKVNKEATQPLNEAIYDSSTQAAANFRKWFGKSVVKNSDGTPKVVYHGTMYEFDEFKRSGGNPENYFGGNVIYFTEGKGDVAANYAGIGPDFKSKIQMFQENSFLFLDDWRNMWEFIQELAEKGVPWEKLIKMPIRTLGIEGQYDRFADRTLEFYFEQMLQKRFYDQLKDGWKYFAKGKSVREMIRELQQLYLQDPQSIPTMGRIDYSRLAGEKYLAALVAIDELGVQTGGQTIPVFLRIEKPVYYMHETEIDTIIQIRFVEDEETGEMNYASPEDEHKALIIKGAFEVYDLDWEDFVSDLIDNDLYLEEGVSVSDFDETLKNSRQMEDRDYAEDGGSGDVMVTIFENLGYDGIVMGAGKCFGMKCTDKVHHYIVFDPCQVKSAIANKGTFSTTNCKLTETSQNTQKSITDAIKQAILSPTLREIKARIRKREGIDWTWTSGGCFSFAEALSKLLPTSEIWVSAIKEEEAEELPWAANHAFIKYGDKFFDASGETTPEKERRNAQRLFPSSEVDCKPVKGWDDLWYPEDYFLTDEDTSILKSSLQKALSNATLNEARKPIDINDKVKIKLYGEEEIFFPYAPRVHMALKEADSMEMEGAIIFPDGATIFPVGTFNHNDTFSAVATSIGLEERGLPYDILWLRSVRISRSSGEGVSIDLLPTAYKYPPPKYNPIPIQGAGKITPRQQALIKSYIEGMPKRYIYIEFSGISGVKDDVYNNIPAALDALDKANLEYDYGQKSIDWTSREQIYELFGITNRLFETKKKE